MGEYRQKADGRRVFSAEFKRQAVQRILTGEKTVAELSRELDLFERAALGRIRRAIPANRANTMDELRDCSFDAQDERRKFYTFCMKRAWHASRQRKSGRYEARTWSWLAL